MAEKGEPCVNHGLTGNCKKKADHSTVERDQNLRF